MNENQSIVELLTNVPEEGLHIRELALLNELSDGYASGLGIRFTKAGPDGVDAELPVSDKLLQITGIVNGGVYCTMAESIGSILGVIAANGKVVVGVNNSTDFLSPVAAGVISAEARVIRAGRNTQLISIEMFHRDKLIARTTLRTMLAPAPAEGPATNRADKYA
ncbi:PaaI family thioesterase [Corynebacterium vitaeruminis]|uniref:PaaI family thioesterase n=1 Tax=Corynebacterium vitaeruminis TaxID=38305 RepID=UPI0005562D59|nr:PaaI family thioesterase [Corynebacterium vitaeruminis]